MLGYSTKLVPGRKIIMSMLEARYFVAKISDAQAVLCDEELATLERLIRRLMMAAEQMARARLLALLSKKIGRTGSKRLTLYFHLLTGKTTVDQCHTRTNQGLLGR